MVILELECSSDIKYSWIDDFNVHQRSAELNEQFWFYKTTSQAKNKKK